MLGRKIYSEIIINKIPADKAIILISELENGKCELTYVQSLVGKETIYEKAMEFLQNIPLAKHKHSQLWLKTGSIVTNVGKIDSVINVMPVLHVATLILRFQNTAKYGVNKYFIETAKINGLKFLSYIPHVSLQENYKSV